MEQMSDGSQLVNRSVPVGNVNVRMNLTANLAATFGDFCRLSEAILATKGVTGAMSEEGSSGHQK